MAVFFLPGFFLAENCFATAGVTISEVSWAGSLESANDEWIELYNDSSQDVNVDGWKILADDASPQIDLYGDIPAKSYFLLERTDDGSAPPQADMFFSGSLGNDGEYLRLLDNNGTEVDFLDASSGWASGDNTNKTTLEICDKVFFSSSAGGTPKKKNSCYGANADSPKEEKVLYRFGDVVINEVFPIPGDGGDEWVELYSKVGGLELSGWYVVDGSGSRTVLTGSFAGGDNFFLVKKIKGSLNNSGDEINLFSLDGNLVDRMVYGVFGSSSSHNAPLPSSGCSIALKTDGLIKTYFSESFSISCSPTPDGANKISAPAEKGKVNTSGEYLFGITEVFANPKGADREDEFIEFHNFGESTVDVSGWRLVIEDGKELEFGKNFLPAENIPARGFLVLYRRDSLAALDNDGGRLELFPPGKKTASQVLEYPMVEEGQSFVDTSILNSSSSAITKKFLINSLSLERWVLSDLSTPGARNEVWSKNRAPSVKFSFFGEESVGQVLTFDASDSVDEDGDDLAFDWDFGDGTILNGENPAHIFVKGGEYVVRLSVSDGKSFNLLEKSMRIEPFPSTMADETPAKGTLKKEENRAVNTKPISSDWLVVGNADKYEKIETKRFSSLSVGKLAQVSGQVVVAPGDFGRQYFYIIEKGCPAVKIYDYDGDFQNIMLGDVVSVKGEVSGTTEKYLKIEDGGDVKKESPGTPPLPEEMIGELSDDDIGRFLQIKGEIKKDSGKILLSFAGGEVRVFLKSGVDLSAGDFKTGEKVSVVGLIVSTPTGISLAPRGPDDIEVLQNQDEGGKSAVSSPKAAKKAEKEATSSPREWVLPSRGRQNRPLVYFLIIFLGIFSFLVFVLSRRNKSG